MIHKNDVIKAINSMPEDIDIDDLMYRLYVLDKIAQGQAAIENGQTTTLEQLKKEIQNW